MKTKTWVRAVGLVLACHAAQAQGYVDHYDMLCVDKPISEHYTCLAEREQDVFNWEASAFAVYDEYTLVLVEHEINEAATTEPTALAKAYFERGQLGLYLVFQKYRADYLPGVVPDINRALELDPTNPLYVAWLRYAAGVVAKHDANSNMADLAFSSCAEQPLPQLPYVCADFYGDNEAMSSAQPSTAQQE